MLNQEELDKQIRQLLGGHSVPPPPRAWQDIEEKLPEKRKKKPLLLFFIFPVAACVAVLAGYFLISNVNKGDKGAEKSFAAAGKNPESIAQKQDKGSDLQLHSGLQAASPANGPYAAGNAAPTGSLPANNSNHRAHPSANYHHKKDALLSQTNLSITGNKPLTIQDLKPVGNDGEINDGAFNHLLANALHRDLSMDNIAPGPREIENQAKDLNPIDGKYLRRPSKTSPASKSSHWEIGLSYSPGGAFVSVAPATSVTAPVFLTSYIKDTLRTGLAMVEQSYEYKCVENPEFAFRLTLGYNFNKHLKLSTGIEYKSITQRYVSDNQVSYYAPPGYQLDPQAAPVNEFNFNYYYLTIPLELEYRFATKSRFGYFVNAGAEWYELLTVTRTSGTQTLFSHKAYDVFPPNWNKNFTGTYTTWPYTTSKNFTGFSANAGCGVSYLFNEHWSAQAGVSLNYMISGLNKDNKYNLFGFAVPMGLYYKF